MVFYSYCFKGIFCGFGNSYITCHENDIYTQDFIENLKKTMKIKFSFDDVVIQNIIPLSA